MVDITEIISEVSLAQTRFIKDRAKEEILIKEWQSNQNKLKVLYKTGINLLKVRTLFQKASEMTQKQLEFHISGLVSTALAAVWDDPYEFKVEFVQRRGKTEADLWLIRNGSKIKPIDASGGGVVDILSIALRMAFWSLTKENRPLLILDEPFKHLSNDLQDKAANMLKLISTKLKLQILMISHISKLVKNADKRIEITNKNNIVIVNN
jgi:DNA repair exonuclease SbcCD ATPase subunit